MIRCQRLNEFIHGGPLVTIDPALLDIVCCPVTHQPLKPLPESELTRLNQAIEQQEIRNRDGEVVETPIDQALATRDGRLAYPVRDGIPVLLMEQGIALVQLEHAEGRS